jgi:catechol 2,3-dioxygenase-like lactoylglutathione lyase family enzyme
MATVRYLVSDVARSMSFYRELLEFEAGFDMLPGGRQILVDDPDGNPIELFEGRA